MSQAHNAYTIGATGIPVDSTLAGQNTNESYLALKNFSPIVLSSTIPTQLPNCPCGYVDISNRLGNDVVFIGGLGDAGDTPYLDPNFPGMGRGQPIFPGNSKRFRVVNVNLLQAIANRNGDIIQITAHLSQKDFTTPTNDPPPNPNSLPLLTVISSSPVNGATAVPTNTVANVILLRNVDPTSVNLTNVTVTPSVGGLTVYVDPGNPVQIDIDPHGSNWVNSTTYTIVITTGVKDIYGAHVNPSFTFSFTAAPAPPPPDVDAPVVQTVTPANGATVVSVNTVVTILINEAEGMDPTTINGTNVTLKNNVNQLIASTITLGPDNKTITITPTSSLAFGTVHNVSVSGCKDVAGNVMTAFTSSFTTVAATQTLRYNVARGAHSSQQPGTGGGNAWLGPGLPATGFGEICTATTGLVGWNLTKVVHTLDTWSTTALTGKVYIRIRSSTGVLRYQFANPIDLGTLNFVYSTTPQTVTFSDPNTNYTTIAGDIVFIEWDGASSSSPQLIIGNTAPSAVYGKSSILQAGPILTNNTSIDVAASIYSTP